ncbi:MAG: hypothetical protein M1812_005244 [Candelaria pacifica]|nr:MAG: hypothetical protein M1812_005244 [Candelaria pacifica]
MSSAGENGIVDGTSRITLNDDHLSRPLLRAESDIAEKPRVSSRHAQARDITAEFSTASAALATGQLVKDEWFTLFESVGALEIMDSKMDSGYLAPGETLDAEYNVTRSLLPEEVIGIMDQLLCHEMSWHRGHPLSQTLFTSLYIDKLLWPEPKSLEAARFGDVPPQQTLEHFLLHYVLRAFCLGLIKSCDYVLERVVSEHYYEEEDFVTNLYNRNLLSDQPLSEILHLLKEALTWLDDEDLLLSNAIKAALASRLNFRKSFLEGVAKDLDVIDDSSTQTWQHCASLLPLIQQSKRLGKPVGESFSGKLQRKLASTVPPRPIVTTSFEEAFEVLKRLCQDASDVVQVLDYHGTHNMLNFMWAFQSRKPQPCVYIRALLQSLLVTEMKVLGHMSIKRLLFDDLAETVLPADSLVDLQNGDVEVPRDPRFQIAKSMDGFITRVSESYLNMFRTLCQNRERIRRNLCHMVTDWDALQIDCEDIDIELRPVTREEPIMDRAISLEPIFAYPLSSWAYNIKLQQMQWVLQTGFELEVYQSDELAGMYWYLQNLTQVRIQHLERIRGFVTRKFKKNKKDFRNKEAFIQALSFLNLSMLEATATQELADALTYLYTILTRLNLIPVPPRPYSTDELRYELRLKPFLNITLPELVPFEQFQALVNIPDDNNAEVLELATQAIGRARKDYELLGKMDAKTSRSLLCEEDWKKNVKDTTRACIATSIAISTIRKIIESPSGPATPAKIKVEIPPAGKGYHDWWTVPKLTPLT